MLVWALANYTFLDPLADDAGAKDAKWRVIVITRAVASAIAVAVIAPSSLPLSGLTLAGVIILPFLRALIPPRYCSELEITASFLFVSATFLMTRNRSNGVEHAWLSVPATTNRIGAIGIVAALALFTVHGGTYIVRGLLKKSGTIPMTDDDTNAIDVDEFNRGRLIGALERVLLLAVVIAGSYEALGFIVAAKGLIRGHDLDKRPMAEYFLIGSLSSVLVAVGTGTLAKWVLASYP